MKKQKTTNKTGSASKPDINPIVPAEDKAKRRLELEKVVDDGIDTVEKVGNALAEIRDGELYKTTHPTFEDYCFEKWGFKRSQAYRLIDAAKIKAELSPMGDIPNERVARALARALPEKRESVFKAALAAAAADGREINFKDVERAAQPPPVVIDVQASTSPVKSHKTLSAKTAEPKLKTKGKKPESVETSASSVTTQLKKLWEEASPTERDNFLKWAKEQAEKSHFECEQCGETFETNTDVVIIYECGECGDHYTTDDTSTGTHRCDSCNKFGSVFTRFGCPECRDGKVVKIEN